MVTEVQTKYIQVTYLLTYSLTYLRLMSEIKPLGLLKTHMMPTTIKTIFVSAGARHYKSWKFISVIYDSLTEEVFS